MHRRVPALRVADVVRRVPPMRRQVLLLLVSLAGIVGGAALIGVWCIGLALIAESVLGVCWSLMRDVPDAEPRAELTHDAVLERYRAAS